MNKFVLSLNTTLIETRRDLPTELTYTSAGKTYTYSYNSEIRQLTQILIVSIDSQYHQYSTKLKRLGHLSSICGLSVSAMLKQYPRGR